MSSSPKEATDSDLKFCRDVLLKALAGTSNNATTIGSGLLSTTPLQNGLTDATAMALSLRNLPSISTPIVQPANNLSIMIAQAHAQAQVQAQAQAQQQQQAANNAVMINMLLAQQRQQAPANNDNSILQAIASARARVALGLTAAAGNHSTPATAVATAPADQSLLPALPRLAASQNPPTLVSSTTSLVDTTCASIAAAAQQQLHQQQEQQLQHHQQQQQQQHQQKLNKREQLQQQQQQLSKKEPSASFISLLQNAQAKLGGKKQNTSERTTNTMDEPSASVTTLNSAPPPSSLITKGLQDEAKAEAADSVKSSSSASGSSTNDDATTAVGKTKKSSSEKRKRRAPPDEAWNNMFERLKAFKELTGTCLVPQRYKNDPKLGNWVHHQRVASRRLTEERIEKLRSIGFSWKANNSWEIMFEKLVAFKQEHGDCVVPCNYELDPKLGRWVDNQRQRGSASYEEGGMGKDRWEKLQAIGFVWSVERTKFWDTMFRRLKRFYDREGHCNIPLPYEKDPQLGRWVQKQAGRKRHLSAHCVKQLDDMGFKWS